MRKSIGVDIGGTKIAVAVVDEAGNLSHEKHYPSCGENREQMFERVVQGIRQVMEAAEIAESSTSLGIGVPGLVDAEKGVAVFQNNLSWKNFPLKRRLHSEFPAIQRITVDNDVYQAAFAEWKKAELTNKEVMVFLTISTGVSCAIFEGGVPLRGQGFAGEIGLYPVRTQQRTSLNRLELIASGKAIEKTAQSRFSDSKMTIQQFFQQYNENNPLAEEIVLDVVDSLVHGMYALICILNPTKIILGGSVILKNPSLLPLIQAGLDKEMIDSQRKLPLSLCLSAYDNNAGVIGAGLSVLN